MRESDGQRNLPPYRSEFLGTDGRFRSVWVFNWVFPDQSEFLSPGDLLIFEAGKDSLEVLNFRPGFPQACQEPSLLQRRPIVRPPPPSWKGAGRVWIWKRLTKNGEIAP
jgi:hypothetical protein